MGRDPQKEIRKAIGEAEDAGLKVAESSGHTWGHVTCACGQRIAVYSTGRNPEFGAKPIRKFTANHRNHEEPR
jgi:altronate dehydratase